jgi:hypothetical protein
LGLKIRKKQQKQFVDPSTSSKILSEAQKQWKEEEEMKQENSQNTTEDLGEEHATSDEDEEEIVEQQTKDLDEFNQVGILVE